MTTTARIRRGRLRPSDEADPRTNTAEVHRVRTVTTLTDLTDAIIVRTTDYREADRIVSMLTRENGRVSALARGARRSARRFAGGLAALHRGKAQLHEGRGDLMHLESFEATRDPAGLAAHVAKTAHAGYVVELAYEFSPPHARESGIFELTNLMLDWLEDHLPSSEGLRWFELKLLREVGLLPATEAMDVSLAIEAVIESLLSSATPFERGRAPSELAPALRALTTSWIAPHLARPLRSRAFLEALAKEIRS